MTLFVDTSVWSLALRRDSSPDLAEVSRLRRALAEGDQIFTTGLVLQELLQGFRGPPAKEELVERFAALPFIVPDRDDHVEAAELRNRCRRSGLRVGTIDALLARLCIRYQLTLLTTDRDFHHVATIDSLRVWSS